MYKGLEKGFLTRFWSNMTVLCVVIALLLAKDLASTSSRCDLLVGELNAARMRHGPDAAPRFTWLIDSLKELSDGQGLGFRLGHTVINRKTLVATGAKLAGSFATVYALLMAMADNEAAAAASFSTTNACTLTTVQVETIKALMAGGNASCSYNVTLDAVLAT